MANELPCEVLCKIFDYLESFDQLVACKQVCRNFYSVINSFFKLRQLAITSYGYFPYSLKWFHSYEDVHDCQCEIRNTRFDLSQFKSNQFANLRALFIMHRCVETQFLNCLAQLENLAIKSSCLKSQAIPLRLSRLQILSIEESEIFDLVELNLPLLSKLKINLFKSYKRKLAFIQFERIEVLECSRYLNMTKKFSNLKFFYCERLCSSKVNDLFAHNQALREIHFNGSPETYAHLKRLKALLGRDDLKLYYSGTYGFHLDDRTIDCCVRNYSKLAAVMPFIKIVNFNCLENNFDALPRRMIQRFVNMFHLEVTGPIRDLNQFKILLNDCGYVNKLVINAALEQNFYEQLPRICPVLKCLEINSRESLCLEFLLSFRSLEAIIVSQKMSLVLAEKIFEYMPTMRHLAFYHQASLAEIAIKAKHELKLSIDPVKRTFSELGELLAYLKSEDYKHEFTFLNEEEKFVRSFFCLN